MSQELQKSTVERAKDALSITGDIKSYELYEKLREYRNNIHPDRFMDEKQKEHAEEKFKEIQSLLAELEVHFQQEKLSLSSSELVIFKPLYDNVYYQQKIDQSESKMSTLELELSETKKLLGEAKELNKQLSAKMEAKADDALIAEMKEIEGIYRVSYQKLRPVGIILLLTGAIAVMSKIEEVSVFIRKYAPIAQGNIDIVLFVFFVITCLLVTKQVIEYKVFGFFVNKHCSARSVSEFKKFLCQRYEKNPEDIKTFTENDVFDYIAGAPSAWKRFLAYFGIRLFHTDTCDNLKKCFINNLLHKKLVQVAEAKDLDRLFNIVRPYSSRRRFSIDDDF
ncbi:MAG: hypothetical protein ABFD66_04805 [Smithella sp.]